MNFGMNPFGLLVICEQARHALWGMNFVGQEFKFMPQ
jgi:hypothetical protein